MSTLRFVSNHNHSAWRRTFCLLPDAMPKGIA
jgi:hypothetical protein